MKILAGIVTFNPELERLGDNIKAVQNQVDKVIIVDNGSKNINDVKTAFSDIEVLELHANKGIATALNHIGHYAIKHKYDWFLTLDQDTVVFPTLIENYKPHLSLPQVGTLTCLFQDINMEPVTIPLTEYDKVDYAITSAALMNTQVFEQSERFDDVMFIDYVDYDINLHYKKLGYFVYRINKIGFYHEIGHQTPISFMGKKAYTFNHSPFRVYYMTRNALYLRRKYGANSITNGFVVTIRDNFIKILFFESEKLKKLNAIRKGVLDGLKMKVKKHAK